MTNLRRALVLTEVAIAAVFTLWQSQAWIMPLWLALVLGFIAVVAVVLPRWEATTNDSAPSSFVAGNDNDFRVHDSVSMATNFVDGDRNSFVADNVRHVPGARVLKWPWWW